MLGSAKYVFTFSLHKANVILTKYFILTDIQLPGHLVQYSDILEGYELIA